MVTVVTISIKHQRLCNVFLESNDVYLITKSHFDVVVVTELKNLTLWCIIFRSLMGILFLVWLLQGRRANPLMHGTGLPVNRRTDRLKTRPQPSDGDGNNTFDSFTFLFLFLFLFGVFFQTNNFVFPHIFSFLLFASQGVNKGVIRYQ